LPAEDRKLLRNIQKFAKESNRYIRATVILMFDDGYTPTQISNILSVSLSSTRRYLSTYQEGGIEALDDDNFVAYSGKLNDDQLKELDVALSKELYLTAAQIVTYIKNTFHVEYTENGVTALLHRLGYSYKKTQPTSSKADPEAQKVFLDQMNELFEELQEDEVLCCMDAVHPTHNVRSAYGWIKKGKEYYVPSNSGRDRVNINATLNTKEVTDVITHTSDTVDTESTITLFKEVEAHYSNKNTIYIICDNARYYRSKKLIEWLKMSKIKLVFLPPYSPNLNLIERLWKYMRKTVIDYHYYKTRQEFTEAIENFFKDLKSHEKALTSLLTWRF
ncbi:IS630 family transposase, partial [Algivirga pacifica]|uniref:IS630 family transposase n=1 Tax=Algivirga pacifica TaxID=1162670 RepID=UPI0031EBAE76